jgi:hypothetical protein
MRRRTVAAAAAVLGVAGTAAALWWTVGPGGTPAAVEPPPVLPTVSAAAPGGTPVPEGFLEFEARLGQPLDPADEVRWTRVEGTDLPPLLSPCGGALSSDADRTGGRQVALVGTRLWKLERLIVYRDEAAAVRAVVERRDALRTCARHQEGDGTVTEWRTEPLAIGAESFFVTGQRFRDDDGIPGNYRGVVMRQGRTVVMYVDFGQRTAHATLADVPTHVTSAAAMSTKLTARPL